MDFSCMRRCMQHDNTTAFVGSTATGTTTDRLYAPLVPSGSYFFLFEVHGGLEGRTNTSTTSTLATQLVLEKWKLGIYATEKVKMTELLQDDGVKSHLVGYAQAVKTYPRDANQDLAAGPDLDE